VATVKGMVQEYLDKKGYEFSWGTVTEELQEIEDFPSIWKFEIIPHQILKRFPQPALLEDLFIFMYRHHPLRHATFFADESFCNWSVMGFEVESEKIIDFRHWIATVFLSKVIPDLLAEAMLIVEQKLTVERCIGAPPGYSLNEEVRFQLCGAPEMLSFNARKD